MLTQKGVLERIRPIRPSALILWGSLRQITRSVFFHNSPFPGSSLQISSGIASIENVLPENFGQQPGPR